MPAVLPRPRPAARGRALCGALLLLWGAGCAAPGAARSGAAKPGTDSGDSGRPDTGGAARERAVVEDGEWLPGGAGTNTLMLGSNAFIMPAANLSPEDESAFYSGNSFFNEAWVEAPASTASRDGLGPVFNARSCSGCHFKDGRAPAPDGSEVLGSLVRLGENGHPHEVYGGQLQDRANPGVPAEAAVAVDWDERPGAYADGSPHSLRAPVLRLSDWAHGDPGPALETSLRVAPQMSGLGLLEAIPDAAIEALADPDDRDGDGISGRVQRVVDPETGAPAIGRFGWKAEQPRVRTQSAGAFAGDMGITSPVAPADDCTAAQHACLAAENGGTPELSEELLQKVAIYAAALAVPVRREWDGDEVLRGKWLFGELGCAACHTPHHQTGPTAPVSGMADQDIWPYTDLLLHDMGPGLADHKAVDAATGQEWRTPPLWGLGMVPEVNGHDHLLHDGRARGHAEAILWHGGEAQPARDAFAALDADDRAALVRFLESL